MKRIFNAILILTCLNIFPNYANPIIYDESVDGELMFGPNIGTLGVGKNIIKGTESLFFTEYFSFTVPENNVIQSINYSISDLIYGHTPSPGSEIPVLNRQLILYDTSIMQPITGFESVNLLLSPISKDLWSSELPIGNGGYQFLGGMGYIADSAEWSFEFSIDIQSSNTISVTTPFTFSIFLTTILILLLRHTRTTI